MCFLKCQIYFQMITNWVKILNKHDYISCDSGVRLRAFACFNQQVSLCFWIMVLFFLLCYESQFYYITVLEVKREIYNHKSIDNCPFFVTYIRGRKEREEVKMKNKSQTLVFYLLFPPVNCFHVGSFWQMWKTKLVVMQWLQRKESLLWTDNSLDSLNVEARNILSEILSPTLQNHPRALHSRKERRVALLCVILLQQCRATGNGWW